MSVSLTLQMQQFADNFPITVYSKGNIAAICHFGLLLRLNWDEPVAALNGLHLYVDVGLFGPDNMVSKSSMQLSV